MNEFDEPECDREGYDPRTNTYHVQHDWESPDSLTHTVVRSIAAITGKSRTELTPLNDVLDAEALEAFLESRSKEAEKAITFSYEGCKVTVRTPGEVVIDESENGPA